MDLQALREKVLAEVMRRLETTAPPDLPPPAKPTSAQPPLAALQAACVARPEAAVPSQIDVLVVLTGRDEVGDGLAEARDLVQQGWQAALVTTPELLHATGEGLLYEVLGGGLTFCRGDEAVARRLVQAARVVLVPALSVTVAAQAANLLAGDLPAAVLVQAILTRKPVVAARDALALGPAPVPFALRRRLEEYMTTLKGYGVVLAEAKRLAVAVHQIIPAPAAAAGARAGAPAALPPPLPVPAPAAAPPPAAGTWDRELAAMIDHTLLKPDATAEQIQRLCDEALKYRFASVCVNPHWVPLASDRLRASGVKICAVIGFPLGATSATAKALEARDVIQKGAMEVDVVINVGALKSGQHDAVLADLRGVVAAARDRALVKVILETGLLTDAEKVRACELARTAGATFVKTSTGFSAGGATVADVALLRRTVGTELGVKASGGIRDLATAKAMVAAGANRLGCSASVAIVIGQGPGKDKY